MMVGVSVDPWWYNIVTGKVEHGPGAPNSERLGPYETQGQAANALELARQRNEKWSQEDRVWNGEGVDPADPEDPKDPKDPHEPPLF